MTELNFEDTTNQDRWFDGQDEAPNEYIDLLDEGLI